jgi:undecaprenyl diphosphate synthase
VGILKSNGKQFSTTDVPVPRHVAIIMDGNGRWAGARGLPRVAGHKRGVETVRQVVRDASELGIEYLTLFSFSSENWQRPVAEVNELMGLLKRFIRRDLANLHEQGVRVRVIGSRNNLDNEIIELIANAESLTENNSGITLIVAFNYGSKQEITDAARRVVEAVQRGELTPEQINPETFNLYLDTAEFPEPDLLIRTSGEQRLSNFLLWQCAYTEFVFVPNPWPDFNKDLLISAIEEFQNRNRRFGAVPVLKQAATGKLRSNP